MPIFFNPLNVNLSLFSIVAFELTKLKYNISLLIMVYRLLKCLPTTFVPANKSRKICSVPSICLLNTLSMFSNNDLLEPIYLMIFTSVFILVTTRINQE